MDKYDKEKYKNKIDMVMEFIFNFLRKTLMKRMNLKKEEKNNEEMNEKIQRIIISLYEDIDKEKFKPKKNIPFKNFLISTLLYKIRSEFYKDKIENSQFLNAVEIDGKKKKRVKNRIELIRYNENIHRLHKYEENENIKNKKLEEKYEILDEIYFRFINSNLYWKVMNLYFKGYSKREILVELKNEYNLDDRKISDIIYYGKKLFDKRRNILIKKFKEIDEKFLLIDRGKIDE